MSSSIKVGGNVRSRHIHDYHYQAPFAAVSFARAAGKACFCSGKGRFCLVIVDVEVGNWWWWAFMHPHYISVFIS